MRLDLGELRPLAFLDDLVLEFDERRERAIERVRPLVEQWRAATESSGGASRRAAGGGNRAA